MQANVIEHRTCWVIQRPDGSYVPYWVAKPCFDGTPWSTGIYRTTKMALASPDWTKDDKLVRCELSLRLC